MATSHAPLRKLGSVELPIEGRWRVDPGHADVGFWGRHFMLAKVRGRFTGVEATVVIGTDPEDSAVEATIDMASVDSGDHTRDNHLRSGDLFDVANFPQAHFRSTTVTWNGSSGTLAGDLTIRDVTRPVILDVEFLGAVVDPWGSDRAVLSATGSIDREAWGLTWNMALETGGLLVSKEIQLELHVELVREE
jgi:polyisoprenoid-binding protein YceI